MLNVTFLKFKIDFSQYGFYATLKKFNIKKYQ